MAFHDEMVEKYGLYENFLYKPLKRPNKRYVCGFGLNNLEFSAQPKVEGKQIIHPGYRAWHNMLSRCNDWDIERLPSYRGITCDEVWKYTSNFILWYKDNYRAGLVLDKDLLSRGNTIYSVGTCMYIPKEINSFLTSADSIRGENFLGVDFQSSGFRARISLNNKSNHLGYFKTQEEAHRAWQLAKIEQAKVLKSRYSFPEMQLVIDRLQEDYDTNLVTEVI